MATTDTPTSEERAISSPIENYIASQPEPKRSDMKALHSLIMAAMPGCRL